jgi:GMP synthase-like glutamine amidotransferase
MGQLIENGEDKWNFYVGHEFELPSEEELQTIKCLILPGSGRSVYDTTVGWIAPLKEFIVRIINDYPHIKIIGGCFGEQVTAQAMGGLTTKMPYNAERPKCLGREWIQPTDNFFEQRFV